MPLERQQSKLQSQIEAKKAEAAREVAKVAREAAKAAVEAAQKPAREAEEAAQRAEKAAAEAQKKRQAANRMRWVVGACAALAIGAAALAAINGVVGLGVLSAPVLIPLVAAVIFAGLAIIGGMVVLRLKSLMANNRGEVPLLGPLAAFPPSAHASSAAHALIVAPPDSAMAGPSSSGHGLPSAQATEAAAAATITDQEAKITSFLGPGSSDADETLQEPFIALGDLQKSRDDPHSTPLTDDQKDKINVLEEEVLGHMNPFSDMDYPDILQYMLRADKDPGKNTDLFRQCIKERLDTVPHAEQTERHKMLIGKVRALAEKDRGSSPRHSG